MKGKIFKWSGHYGNGYVLDETGKQYFVHESEVLGRGKLRNGVIIEFDSIEQPDRAHDRAVNIKKVGHGVHHPFIKDLEHLKSFVSGDVPNAEEEKAWRIRDIDMLINYFSEIEDAERYDNVRAKFRSGLEAPEDV